MRRTLLTMAVLTASLVLATEPSAYTAQVHEPTPYESLNIVLFQDFFDSVTANLIAPLIQKLPQVDLGKVIPDVTNGTLPIEEIISFDYNLTGWAFADANYNGAVPIVKVSKDMARIQLSNLTLNLTADYAYVSDPPILADIGSAYLGIDTLSLDVNLTSLLTGDELNVTIEGMELNFENAQPLALFDGLADFSELATNAVNTAAAVVRNRLVSFVNGGLLTNKVNAFLNKVIHMIPPQIDLGKTGLYLDGGLYRNFEADINVLQIPLKTVLAADAAEYTETCDMATLPNFNPDMEEYLQVLINGCFLNQALFSLHSEDLLHASIENN